MDGHPTPSPSHSASASATSPFLKRKLAADDHAPPFPSSFSDARNGLTFNGNLGSVSTSGADSNTDTDDEMEYDHSSMRNFTAFRLQNNAGENSVRIESSDGGKYGGNGSAARNSANSAPIGGVNVKDGSFNSGVLGAYCAREESLKREEESGRLKFVCCSNDGTDEHMIWLIGLKNVISKQLTNMPKEYIVRLVMDRNHKSVILLSRDVVVGGITYRPYPSQKFAEIAFCAIAGDEQVKGYGTRLMNHLKMHARDVDGLTHFLTYADNNAVGYFVKQGFTKKIQLPRELWFGYIKDYDGGILMECKIDPKFPYTDLSTMIRLQRLAIDEKIRELSNRHTVYQAIDFQKDEAGIPTRSIKVEDIPGLREAGWNPGQYGHSQYKMIASSAFMRHLVKIMHDHPDGWPFKEPVDARDVPDYYDVIMDPIDLQTLSKRVESEVYYVTLDMFIADVKRMFQNARTYNTPETIYYKCSTRLESHIMNIFQSGLQSGVNKTW